jgi:uncharacterized protein (DUF1778 family)
MSGKEPEMATKTERVEARLTASQRERIDQAASFEGTSLSSFIVAAAAEKAEQVIAARTTTVIPSEYFDDLLSAIDQADQAPALERAAIRVRQRGRIG